jgi:hypothetical protein
MSTDPGHRQAAARQTWRVAVLAALLALAACSPPPQTGEGPREAGGWREFQGSWNATGTRYTIPLGAERRASIARLSGTLLLAGPSIPGAGFRGEAITLNDSATGMIGRAVWIDERGDAVFSELRGQQTATGNRVTGTFVGGTGRYTGATGEYEFSWQYVVEADEGVVQGRTVGLKGRVRVGATESAAAPKGDRP